MATANAQGFDRFCERMGQRLCRLRERAGLTQRELADDVGVQVAYVSRLENGRARPSLELVYRLAQVLGVEPSDLLRAVGDSRGTSRSEEPFASLRLALRGQAPADVQLLARLVRRLRQAK